MNEISRQTFPAQPGQPAQPAPPVPPVPPVPPAPPKSKRALKTVGTVLGIAAGVVIGKLAVAALLGGTDGPADAGRYKLVPPATFQSLSLQDSGPRVDAIKQGQNQSGPAKPGTTRVAVVYADQAGTAQLVVSGAAGSFHDKDPGAELTNALKGMGLKEAEITTHEAGNPAGGAMRCGTVVIAEGSMPMCMWADHSSLVTVTVPIENKPVTIDALAARARELRAVMEVSTS
ncbi:hypothetical protein OG239_17085 [Streptomyces sp. NBC_00868]|uniref:hypothetical protein n=1 Tax=unclassified Streptomyces TaxID=2593676 RepID=UPI003254C760|nr:hypothetical protein OG239_17085 [Streptomyces sp. NBC_00868]